MLIKNEKVDVSSKPFFQYISLLVPHLQISTLAKGGTLGSDVNVTRFNGSAFIEAKVKVRQVLLRNQWKLKIY